jgi:2'-5' RNA ligase
MDAPDRRLFIALPVDDENAVKSLGPVFENLKKNESFLKPVPSGNYHITLKFFGSVESGQADSIANAFLSLDQLKKIEYKIEGIGTFPSIDNPSVIWAGLKCDEKALSEVFKTVERFAAAFGFFPEKRKFMPHLTLARIRNGKKISPVFQEYIIREKHSFFTSSVFRELVLFESVLKNTGSEYKRIEVIKLL